MADETIRVRMELIDKTSATLKNISKQVSSLRKSFNNLEKTSAIVTNNQTKVDKAVKSTDFSIRDLIASVGALTLAYKGLQVAQSAIMSSDQLVTSKARLSIISDDPDTMLQDVYQMAQNVRSDFMEMSGTVAKMGINVGVGEGQWFKNTDQLIRFNELLAKTFKTGGQNNKEIAAGMLQLTQAMSSGRLQGDEFRSMFENAPLYISYIGEYMAEVDGHVDKFGNTIAYTAGELKQLAAEGKITTDIMINAMMTGSEKIEEQFKHLPVTIEDRWTQMSNMLRNQAKTFFERMNNVVNAQSFTVFLDQLSEQLTVILGTLADVLTALSPVINVLLTTWKYWSPIAVLVIGYLGLIFTKVMLLQAGITKTAVATKLATVETQALATNQNIAAKAMGYLNTQFTIFGRLTNAFYDKAAGFSGAVGKQAYNYELATIKAQAHAKGLHMATVAWQNETVQIISNTVAKHINTLAEKSNMFAKLRAIIAGNAHVVSLSGQTLATRVLTVATTGLAVALNYMLLPLTIMLGVFWVIIKVINMMTGSTYTLTGVLMGVLNIAVTAITNGLIDLYNALASVYNFAGSMIDGKRYHVDLMERHSYSAAWHEGLDYGNIGKLDYTGGVDELAGIKGDTDKIVDNTQASAEDMKFLRELAEDRVASRISNINVSIVNNNDMKVNSDRDLDGIVDYITVGLEEAINSGASGVHT